ncbi:MAG: hypothetical protein ISS49_16485 [Anaerolineae bacterium]|nr:hypothetical protein [Anaerolineae bacterium]
MFRTEAVRAGFKHAWHERSYQLIVKVAERLPASVLQEYARLLMYYDDALMRAESEPMQGRLVWNLMRRKPCLMRRKMRRKTTGDLSDSVNMGQAG